MKLEPNFWINPSIPAARFERDVQAASDRARLSRVEHSTSRPGGRRNWLKRARQILFVCFAVSFAASAQQASPRLIPFQGRLTDQQGRAYTNGQFTLTFSLYGQAVGGTPLWTERHQKVGVINGMVNVFLGSINSLTNQDFSETRHLGITIDADDNPTTSDPEMVPRQMIIPAFWAKQAENSTLLAGTNWSAILVSGNNPATGFIRGDRLQLASITTDRLVPNAITTDKIAAGAIQTSDIGDGQITVDKLAPSFQLDTVIPPGTIQAFGGQNIPGGWLLCNGSPYYQTNYPRLFAAIGTAWGAGHTNGVKVGDFNVPDLRGYFLRGVSQGTTRDPDRATRTASNIGGNTGDLVGSLQDEAFRQHTHSETRYFDDDNNYDPQRATPTGDDNGRLETVQTGPASVGGGNETRPDNAYVHYIIKY